MCVFGDTRRIKSIHFPFTRSSKISTIPKRQCIKDSDIGNKSKLFFSPVSLIYRVYTSSIQDKNISYCYHFYDNLTQFFKLIIKFMKLILSTLRDINFSYNANDIKIIITIVTIIIIMIYAIFFRII